jgi:hypothetical protein
VVERLAADIQQGVPGMAGFSPQNIWKMRGLFLAWTAGFEISHKLREYRFSELRSLQTESQPGLTPSRETAEINE